MSLRDISSHISEMYDTELSHTVLSKITGCIFIEVKAWQSRPLEAVYCIVWMDAARYKVRVTHKVLYNILGINRDGYKQVLGTYISESEGDNFWLQVLTDMQNRGLEDILIACTDNLTGFKEAIESTYPKADVQSCIVHQIRNSLKYVASKDQKEFMRDLKRVYRADTKDLAELALDELAGKWESKYPVVNASWRVNWEKLTTYFQYTQSIRTLIDTTKNK
ncbi:Transposase, Mutator family [Fodinibius sediminis]|uniref:Mutator family transposase n=1 Tax=Fodinibius sediminis TaxID=1214077 RepID=A0A521CGF1_9BACT|nr:Transposase, Mutator family [Fodinibius sediminis]